MKKGFVVVRGKNKVLIFPIWIGEAANQLLCCLKEDYVGVGDVREAEIMESLDGFPPYNPHGTWRNNIYYKMYKCSEGFLKALFKMADKGYGPQGPRSKRDERIGEVRRMNNGLKARIIGYRTVHDIDVMFENGCVERNRYYKDFKRGHIDTLRE